MSVGDTINGVSYPMFRIATATDSEYEWIDFELCGEAGYTEDYTEDFKRVQLRKDNRFIDYDFKGSRIKFILDYSEYIKADMLFNIEKIFAYNSQPDTYTIYFYPRSEKLNRFFEVRLEDGQFSLQLLPDRKGHTLPVLRLISTITQIKNFVPTENEVFRSPYLIWK